MAKSYKGVNLNGDALMHYRTKGSRNGYSKNPNYRAVGQRATGRLVNGRYVYDTPKYSSGNSSKPAISGTVKKSSEKPANVSQEYWDNLQYNTNPNYKPEPSKPKKGINTSIDPRYAKRSTQHGTPWVSEEYKQELAYNTGKSYTPKKNAINVNTDPRYKKQETNTGLKGDPRYSVAGTNKIDRAKIEALSKKRIKGGTSKSGNMSVDGLDFNVSNRGKTITDYGAARAHQNAVNQANAEARARNAIANRGSSSKKMTKQLKNFSSGQKSKEYEEALAYNSKKNVYPSGSTVTKSSSSKSTKPGMNYSNDPRFQRSETQNKVINEAMKLKDSQFRAAGIKSDGYDAAYRRGVEKKVAEMVPDRIQEARAIGLAKQANKTAAEKKAEQKRIKQGQKAREKRNSKKQSLISKIKSLFSKKK